VCNILSFYSAGEPDYGETANIESYDQAPELSLLDRLGKAATLDIESTEFSWDSLLSLHHTKHTSSAENSEDEMTRALEVCFSGPMHMFTMALLLSFEPCLKR